MRMIRDIFWGLAVLAVGAVVIVFAFYVNAPMTVSGEVISARVARNNFGADTLIVVHGDSGEKYYLGWETEYNDVLVGDRIEARFRQDCFYTQHVTETVEDGWHRFDRDNSRCFNLVQEYRKL